MKSKKIFNFICYRTGPRFRLNKVREDMCTEERFGRLLHTPRILQLLDLPKMFQISCRFLMKLVFYQKF